MQRCADAIFRPRRITTDQFSLLFIVDRHDGIRQNELANELFTDPNTVTAMLARLEKRGLVQREVCAKDGRARRVRLTPAGRRLTGRLSDDWEPMRRRLREVFSGDAGQEALRVLDQVQQLMMESRAEVLEKQAAGKRRQNTRTKPGSPAAAEI
ncbi:MAG TPA: MarR family transcriptional regulator [Bryobacteraceae bacterium]|nr:MarR family transcriptional regulator [Bryobacteraceae bacterium]